MSGLAVKISVITVCCNAAATIASNLQSVARQGYPHVEHIIVDGASNDGTVEIVRRHADLVDHWVSESDAGIYDAMNKGIAMAKGDVIGFLNADDVYAHDDVLSKVAEQFRDEDLDCCFADLVFVKNDRVVRSYSSARFTPERIAWGWMPAHPTLYVRRALFEQFGMFKTDYRIAADYEFVARVLGRHRCSYRYVPDVWVKMGMGGVSTRNWKSRWILNREIVRGCRENGIRTNLFKVLSKFPLKLLELVRHEPAASGRGAS